MPNPFERQFLIRIEGVRGSNPLSSTQTCRSSLKHPMTAKSSPAFRESDVSGQIGGEGCRGRSALMGELCWLALGVTPCPPRLDLTQPGSAQHPSSGLAGGGRGALASVRVLPKERAGFVPARQSAGLHQAAVAVTCPGSAAPLAIIGSQGTRWVVTTKSWRSSAAARALRALPSLSLFCPRPVRCAWRAV